MTNFNNILDTVDYYESIFKQYPKIENPIAILDSDDHLKFISAQNSKASRPTVDQLKVVLELFGNISGLRSTEPGMKQNITKLTTDEYETLVKKLHFIEQRSLEIAREKAAKSPSRDPIPKAQSKIKKAFVKIERTYHQSRPSVDTPAVLKEIEKTLQHNSSKGSEEIEGLYKKYVTSKHTLNGAEETVDQLSKIFTSLQSQLSVANRKMNHIAKNVENKDPGTKWQIFDNLRSFDTTVKGIFKSLETHHANMEKEIKELLIVPEIETALAIPVDPDRLGSLINEKFLKLATVYSKLAPALSKGTHMEPSYFLVNLSQMQLIMANLKLLKEQIVTLTNPDDATAARERFARSETLNEAEMLISALRKNPLWKKALDEKRSVANFTFKTNFWLFKDIKLQSMSDVQKLTEILGIYRDNLKEVYLEAKKLSSKTKQPNTLPVAPQAVAVDETTLRKSESYVKKPMI